MKGIPKKDFFSLTKEELEATFESQKIPRFRARQLLDWVYQRGIIDPSQMTNLALALRQQIEANFSFSALEFVRAQDSGDGETFKFLWRLPDRKLVESVLICSEERRTVCVSSQVGCPAKCAFCASGQKGFFRNLSAAEIHEQVWRINQYLAEKGERVSHIVFMGMGEPMANLEAVIKTIYLLNAPSMLQISQRRITVSTVGLVEGINRLAEEKLHVNLALSLHAPNQNIRKKIINYARKYPLPEIMHAMDQYSHQTNRDITYEYILISGINDKEEHAHELVKLISNRHCTVNLIPYNPISGIHLKRSTRQAIEKFRKILEQAQIIHTCRYTKGDDIAAACGQLALQEFEA